MSTDTPVADKTTSLLSKIAQNIIKSQEDIIGPVAIEQARRVPHLAIDWEKRSVVIDGNGAEVIDELVRVYKELFGQISVEVSKEAAGPLISQLPANELPEALK